MNEPEVWRDGDYWIAEIDYCAQGDSREDAIANFGTGWRDTRAAREKANVYANDGAALAESFARRFNDELALSGRVEQALTARGVSHLASTTEQYRELCDLLDADAKVIAELRAITGPKLPCGCFGVQVARLLALDWYACEHGEGLPVTPEYTAWRESRARR